MNEDKIKVVFYARVSSEDQKEKQSIESQIEYLNEWIIKEDLDLVDSYIDDGLSAKDMNRPDIQRLIEDIPKRKFSMILTLHNDRLSRNTRDILEFSDLCRNHKIILRFGNFDLDITTPEGEMLFTGLASYSQYFRRDLGRKTSLGMQKRKRDGKWMGRVSRFYTKNEDGTLYPKQIVFEVYDLKLQGRSIRTIAKKVKIPKSTIHKMIKCYEWWINPSGEQK